MTAEQLLQQLAAEQAKKPALQRATRRETLDGILQCLADAVRERDAQKGVKP